jgi:hypothetical protein
MAAVQVAAHPGELEPQQGFEAVVPTSGGGLLYFMRRNPGSVLAVIAEPYLEEVRV